MQLALKMNSNLASLRWRWKPETIFSIPRGFDEYFHPYHLIRVVFSTVQVWLLLVLIITMMRPIIAPVTWHCFFSLFSGIDTVSIAVGPLDLWVIFCFPFFFIIHQFRADFILLVLFTWKGINFSWWLKSIELWPHLSFGRTKGIWIWFNFFLLHFSYCCTCI